MQQVWDPKRSIAGNMVAAGLRSDVNGSKGSRYQEPTTEGNGQGAGEGGSAVSVGDVYALFDVPKTEEELARFSRGRTKRDALLPMSVASQKYIFACLEKFGTEYGKASFDIDLKRLGGAGHVNPLQYTERKLEKMGDKFLLLKDEERADEVDVSGSERVLELIRIAKES
eukprot:CAMPEP_0194279862 /NCGR_PEP_ID=MMETSP0169-20130528/14169_1 /TAXON_ID=218684 /ORGANISM="Corethron pennatum, Strain L29A3" /LENGTH=169 /DNA_ID=CAMNT_0039024339 /DNA_START=158 /DNA_END=667 /DNA_ORIENTATION=-